MINKPEAQQIVQKIFDISPADETEAILMAETAALTRFANNIIHQNVAKESHTLLLRARVGQKVGTATINAFDAESLKRAIASAMMVAKMQPDDPELLPLPEKQVYPDLPEPFEPATMEFSPAYRAEAVAQIVKASEASNLTAAGAFSTGASSITIANSNGLFAYQKGTSASLSLTIQGTNSSGWAEIQDKNVHKLDPQQLAESAIQKALQSKDPIAVPPGVYTVILEPEAVNGLAFFMAILGFGAQRYQEGRSFIVGKLGTKMLGENITMLDNAYDPRLDGTPFDIEGMPKQQVKLVEHGVVKNVVYDRQTAHNAGVETTGHALLPQQFAGPTGPLPSHLVIQGGDATIEEMIAATEQGIYVTRFHYLNVVNPMTVTITGMTRDGTFLIEDGKIKCGIKNLRFTESALNVFSNVASLSRNLTRCSTRDGQSMLAPAMKINNFTFSSGTEF